MSTFTLLDAEAAGWAFVNATPASVDQNSGRVTPPSYTAEKFLNDNTITEQADSPELLLELIKLFEQQLKNTADPQTSRARWRA